MLFTKVHLMRSDAFSLLRNPTSSGQSVEIYSAENPWCTFICILARLFVLKALHNTEIRSNSPGWFFFFFLLALNCNTVFAVLTFYSGVTDWKDSWEVLLISPRFYVLLFWIWGRMVLKQGLPFCGTDRQWGRSQLFSVFWPYFFLNTTARCSSVSCADALRKAIVLQEQLRFVSDLRAKENFTLLQHCWQVFSSALFLCVLFDFWNDKSLL